MLVAATLVSRGWSVAVVVAVLVLAGAVVASARGAGSDDSSGTLRNQRYCEIIPAVVSGGSVTSYVYNTQGLNDCPAAQWDALTEDEVNEEFGSQSATLNGPRYWMLDSEQATGASSTGQVFTFGGIEASLRATLVTPVGTPTVGEQFYVPNTVQRQTIFTFDAKKPIYELVDPDGNVYVMQSYAQIYAKTLTIDQLPFLGSYLKLPSGWSYRMKIPQHDIQLTANGVAYVVNDDLANSYQQMIKPGLQLGGIPTACVRRLFTVSIQVSGDTADTQVRLGKHWLFSTTSKTFTVTVPVSESRGESLLFTAVATNDAGTARASVPFRVCD
jgi:hypothetical protein